MNSSLRIHWPAHGPRIGFAAYARAGRSRLVGTALLLCGDPREAAELVRNTLVGVCARWRRIPRDDVDFYVRRSLVREYLRRVRRRRKAPGLEGLGALTARQRAVLVMLHWEGLGETEVAQTLGCSAGAVRSHARRGLAALGGDAERLRGLFAEAAEVADGLAPFAVQLGAIEQRGRVLRRRRVGVIAAVCVLLLVPAALFATDRIGGAGSASGSGAQAVGMASSPIRIVAPGERVEAVPGVQVWLTADGRHWSTAQGPNQFRRLPEAGSESRQPGVSVRPEPVKGAYFLSGLYYGLSADPARVAVTVDGREVTGSVLTLAGNPGWGVWYARTPLPTAELKASYVEGGPMVTVYDAAGQVVARSGGDE
ncbi:sigma factor-like helix-turn-helix DNA-binding protein [Streptomyces sp. GESEQ-4]|uniref:sigma factor-like helix-turn-helix DNA-binding protein n=1 Tax=Streptomyces sp. GESEQ-4 TaxID=2812655 RepID=UPI001B325045|nr:sigma factor-like helix-turn-helix DNA-binding protein [Streptomyces sp. GESEQ-4]